MNILKYKYITIFIFLLSLVTLRTSGASYLDSETSRTNNFAAIAKPDHRLTLEQIDGEDEIKFRLDYVSDITRFVYELTYDTDGDTQGAGGDVTIHDTNSISREIYLGTCSDTCTPHIGVHNIKLVVKLYDGSGLVRELEASL
jgi:hypothetical protein